jgi:short-subunit dehydrogenase
MMPECRAALVTGASSVVGEAFARALAARGADLLITALPADEVALGRLADELTARHGIRCLAFTADLARPDGPDQLHAAAQDLAFEPDLVVNSAGFGRPGHFVSTPLEVHRRTVHLNVEAIVHVSRLFLPAMAARGSGAVVNIASTAAFQPQPFFAVYAASKAFLLRLGEALWAEQRRTGVRVVTVCPGPVGRPPTRPEGPVRKLLRRRFITPEAVAERALQAVAHDRPVVVLRMPVLGRAYHVRAVVSAVLPRRARARLAGRLNRWYLDRA